MSDDIHHSTFLNDYTEYVKQVLQPTEVELRDLFFKWRDPNYWGEYTEGRRVAVPSPIHRTRVRIKRPESVVDKIKRKPSGFVDGVHIKSVKRMSDSVAGRIIVYFLSHLVLVDKEIRESERLEISTTDPPKAYLSAELVERLGLTGLDNVIKDSGYASIHYIVRFNDSRVPVEERPWVEIQVRTLAEDLWGEIEHVLGYKPGKHTSFAVRKQFRLIASLLSTIDEHFNFLHEELSRFQLESQYKDADPLNAENLPAVLNDLGIGCAQREINGLLKLLTSRGIESVGALLTDSDRRIELIRHIHLQADGRPPAHFEVVSSLAAAHGFKETEAIQNAVKAQIELFRAWEMLKSLQDTERNR